MRKYAITYLFILIFTFVWWFNFVRPSEDMTTHICRDYNLAATTVKAYKNNPDELTKFHYKRTKDCEVLLAQYAQSRGIFDKWKKCPVLDSTYEAILPLTRLLIMTYNDYSTAKREVTAVSTLIRPFKYCPQYANINKTLNEYKEHLGL